MEGLVILFKQKDKKTSVTFCDFFSTHRKLTCKWTQIWHESRIPRSLRAEDKVMIDPIV